MCALSSPQMYAEPATIADLREILQRVASSGKRIKVQHTSQRNSTEPDCFHINMQKFSNVLKMDRTRGLVKAESGITVGELQERLSHHGLAINVVSMAEGITLAEAISSAAHGTGANNSIMPALVTQLELVTAGGDLLALSLEDDPDMMRSVCAGLGGCGVIVSATLRCVPSFSLHALQSTLDLDSVLEHINVHIDASEFYHFLWFPFTEKVISIHQRRLQKDCVRSKRGLDLFSYTCFIILWLYCIICRTVPSLVPFGNKFHLWLFSQNPDLVRSVEQASEDPNRVIEWAIPRSERRQTEAYIRAFCDVMRQAGGRPRCYNINIKDLGLTNSDLSQMYPGWEKFCATRMRMDPKGCFLSAHLKEIMEDKSIKRD